MEIDGSKNRFELVGTLPGTLETWYRHRVRNLSPGGALVESAVPLPPGSRLTGRAVVSGQSAGHQSRGSLHSGRRRRRQGRAVLIGLAWADGTAPMEDVLTDGALQPQTLPERRNGGSGRACRSPTAPR